MDFNLLQEILARARLWERSRRICVVRAPKKELLVNDVGSASQEKVGVGEIMSEDITLEVGVF